MEARELHCVRVTGHSACMRHTRMHPGDLLICITPYTMLHELDTRPSMHGVHAQVVKERYLRDDIWWGHRGARVHTMRQ